MSGVGRRPPELPYGMTTGADGQCGRSERLDVEGPCRRVQRELDAPQTCGTSCPAVEGDRHLSVGHRPHISEPGDDEPCCFEQWIGRGDVPVRASNSTEVTSPSEGV